MALLAYAYDSDDDGSPPADVAPPHPASRPTVADSSPKRTGVKRIVASSPDECSSAALPAPALSTRNTQAAVRTTLVPTRRVRMRAVLPPPPDELLAAATAPVPSLSPLAPAAPTTAPPAQRTSSAQPAPPALPPALPDGRTLQLVPRLGDFLCHVYVDAPATLLDLSAPHARAALAACAVTADACAPTSSAPSSPPSSPPSARGAPFAWLRMPDDATAHVSLSRLLVLREHQIDDVLERLREAFVGVQPLRSVLLSRARVFSNDSRTRHFAALCAGDGATRRALCALVHRVDVVLCALALPTFYERADPHVTIAWSVDARALQLQSARARDAGVPLDHAALPRFDVTHVCVKIGSRIHRIALLLDQEPSGEQT